MVRHLVALTIGCLALFGTALAQAPQADAPASSDALASQAQYWEAKGRFDLARESWLKLLRVSPDNVQALAGLATAEAEAGRVAPAQHYLDRLRETHPEYPGIRAIEDSIRLGSFDQKRLAEPRALVQAGDYEGALAKFRAVYGNDIPGGRLGLEYYQVLAGTKDGWSEARTGIEALAKANPEDPVYKLALAQHLTYNSDEAIRRRGISDLMTLAEVPAVATQVRQAWRQALIWLGARKGSDEGYYRSYLKKYGDDPLIAQKLAALEKVGSGGVVVTTEAGEVQAFGGAQPGAAKSSGPAAPTPEQIRGQKVKAAFEALDAQDLDTATAGFQDVLAEDSGNADALGGLGVIRLRQQRYAESRQYLENASARAPKSAGRWKEALSTARFWEMVRQGDAAREATRLDQAERLYRSALELDAKRAQKEFSVRITLADVLAEQERFAEAEKIYRDVLARNPEAADASRGLIGILTRSGRLAEAIALAERLPAGARAELGGLGALKGQYLREQAKIARENGDEARAEALLKEALLLDPESSWTRLDLARIYQRQKRIREANTLIDGLLTSGKQLADAIYIKALLLAEQQDWYNGLTLLDQVSPANRTPEMAQLQRRLWVRYQTERAGVLARYGRAQEAVQVLSEVEPEMHEGSNAELLGAMAQAWADIGEEGRALSYMRQALSRQESADPGLRLQYASLLFKLRQDAEFEVVMEDLVKYRGWDEQQSIDLANLRIAYRLRQADLVREDGDLARAYEYIEPLLRVNPNDPRLIMALARLYNDAKEYDRVTQLYQRALQIDPNNLDAYKGAIGAALATNKGDVAEELLDRAFELDPENPRLYALAGRAAKQRGEDGRALELFRQALLLDQAKGGESEFNSGGDSRYSPKLYLLNPEDRAPVPQRTPDYYGALSPRPDASPPPQTVRVSLQQHTQGPATRPGLRLSKGMSPSLRARFWRAVQAANKTQRPRSGRLIRTSTKPRQAAPAQPAEPAPAYIPPADAGVWVQDGADRFSYSLQQQAVSVPYGPVDRSTPAPLAYQYQNRSNDPRDYAPVFPREHQRLSNTLSQQPRRRESLRSEVQRDIDELLRKPGQQADMRSAAPEPRYPAAPRPSEMGYVPPPGMYEVPRIDPPSRSQYPVVELGSSVQAYEREGLRVLPPDPYPSGMDARLTTYADPMLEAQQPQAAYARPYGSPVQLRQDPVLATPGFVLERRRPRQERPNEMMREIAGLQAKRSTWFSLGLSMRNRDGVSGLDRLYDLEMPAEFSFAGERAGRFKLRAVPVFLDAGTVSGAQLPLFGSLALVDDPTLRFGQQATGVALGVAYSAGDLRLDVGSSPLGFPLETITGGLNWRPKFEDLVVQLDLSRRSITDSKLSYAGAYDPGLGRYWGGSTKNGGRLDVAYNFGDYGIYGNGSYHFIDGVNTAQNSVVEAGGGVYSRLLERRNMRVTYGLNLTTFFYDKNLRRFTYGHGGYFSPQSYLALTVPVEWEGGRDRFSYKLNGAIGLQGFREEGSALYPNDSGLQAALEDFAAGSTTTIATGYSSQSSTGLGFAFSGSFEYLVGPNVIAGARLGVDNARDYKEAYALGYLRYLLTPQGRVEIPPAPLFPYYNFGDPRL